MDFIHEKNRVYAEDECGKLLAEITFPDHDYDEDVVVIDHTFVAPELRGQNVAAGLVQAAYDNIKAQGRRAVVCCPYAAKWFEKHPEARDIIAA